MQRPAPALFVGLFAVGLLGCRPGGDDQGPSSSIPDAGACTVLYGKTDVCVETDEAGCENWGARKAGSTHQFSLGGTCSGLGFAYACDDGFLHKAECISGACGSVTSCESCTAQLACGWCGVGVCEAGTASGPSDGTCTGWVWTAPFCPAPVDPCQARRPYLCNGCTTTPGCGWCPSSATCVTGTASGPTSGSCPVASWGDRWTATEAGCPVPDPCRVRSGCATCTALAGCGYCATTFSCLSGTAAGPSSGVCQDWRFSAATCTANPNACSECLSSCRGLPGCCTGTGCICDGEC